MASGGADISPLASNFARMNASMGVCTHDEFFTLGGACFAGRWKALKLRRADTSGLSPATFAEDCVSEWAPESSHFRRVATCASLKRPSGGILILACVWLTTLIKRLLDAGPGS